jgi:hypothetical protein
MSTPVNPPVQPPADPTPQPATPAPARKSAARARITLAVLVALLAVGGYFAYKNWGSEASRTNVGDCVSITGAKFDPKFEKLACDSPNATHVVAKSLGTSSQSCGDPYGEFTETLDGEPSAKLCLIPNYVEGTCFKSEVVSIDSSPDKIDCSAADAIKVVKVVRGIADKSVCPEDADAEVYPEPPTTQCLALAKP